MIATIALLAQVSTLPVGSVFLYDQEVDKETITRCLKCRSEEEALNAVKGTVIHFGKHNKILVFTYDDAGGCRAAEKIAGFAEKCVKFGISRDGTIKVGDLDGVSKQDIVDIWGGVPCEQMESYSDWSSLKFTVQPSTMLQLSIEGKSYDVFCPLAYNMGKPSTVTNKKPTDDAAKVNLKTSAATQTPKIKLNELRIAYSGRGPYDEKMREAQKAVGEIAESISNSKHRFQVAQEAICAAFGRKLPEPGSSLSGLPPDAQESLKQTIKAIPEFKDMDSDKIERLLSKATISGARPMIGIYFGFNWAGKGGAMGALRHVFP